jgi:hypothetical protein
VISVTHTIFPLPGDKVLGEVQADLHPQNDPPNHSDHMLHGGVEGDVTYDFDSFEISVIVYPDIVGVRHDEGMQAGYQLHGLVGEGEGQAIHEDQIVS